MILMHGILELILYLVPYMLQFHENSSFEAKNITCDFLHESSFLAIEITKDIFADDKKCKKVQESGIKRLFCIFLPYGQKDCDQFSPFMCAILRVFQPCGQLQMWSNL